MPFNNAHRLANALPIMVAYIDAQRVYQFVNDAYLAFFGLRAEQIIGKHVSDIVSEESEKKLLAIHNKVFRGETVSFRDRLALKEGEEIFINVTYSPEFDDDTGEPLGLYACIENITPYVSATELLRAVHNATHDRDLSSSGSIDALLELGLDYLNMKIGLVSQIQHQEYSVRWSASKLDPIPEGTQFELGNTYCSVTLHANSIISTHHAAVSDEYKAHPCYQQFNLESYIGVPIRLNNRPWGTLSFSSPERRDQPFSEMEQELIRLIASAVEKNLEDSVRLDAMRSEIDKYQQKAMTDGLTLLPNREAANDFTKRHLMTDPSNLHFAVIDIDRFKAINDTYGHDAGDKILMQLAVRLSNATRQQDLVARYGGEEFIMQVLYLNDDNSHEYFERVRQSVEAKPFEIANGKEINVSVSIGYTKASFSDSRETLFKRADSALYKAKSSGRNCTHQARH